VQAIAIPGSSLAAPSICYLGENKDGVDQWELQKAYRYADGSGAIKIPKGFVFDCSVPSWLHWLIQPTKLSIVAPLVHDYLCRTRGVKQRYTPLAAHQIFFTIMRREKVKAWRAIAAFLAVVAFGPKRWTG